MFANEKQATMFLGVLDSIFLFSYAMVGTQQDFLCGLSTSLSFVSLSAAPVHTGAVLQRCDWGQSEPALRALLRPVWLCFSGEYT